MPEAFTKWSGFSPIEVVFRYTSLGEFGAGVECGCGALVRQDGRLHSGWLGLRGSQQG